VVQLRAVLRPAEGGGEDLQRRHPGGEGAPGPQLLAQQVLQAEEDDEQQDVPEVAAGGQPADLLLDAAERRPGQADDDREEGPQDAVGAKRLRDRGPRGGACEAERGGNQRGAKQWDHQME